MATISTTPPAPPTPQSPAVVAAKSFLKSKTFWSTLVVIVTAIGHMVQTGQIGNDDIITIVGAIGALYGRIVAQGPLTASGS